MTNQHDTAYRKLFSHPEMVRDLLRAFLPQPWGQPLDLNNLEKVNSSHVSEGLHRRYGDLIWRVDWGEQRHPLYVLLEFQSTIERFMALRTTAYTALLYQDLLRAGHRPRGARLPPVLPVVLYNGLPRWRAPTDLRALIQAVPEALEVYQPHHGYLLLDQGAYQDLACRPGDNLAVAVFRLEQAPDPERLREILQGLINCLELPRQADLHRSLIEWLWQRLRLDRLPGADLSRIETLQEVHSMLSERVLEWNRSFIEQGLEQGLKQGREQGLEQGREQGLKRGREQGLERGRATEARTILERLLTRRFGALPASAQARLEQANLEEMETWLERVLDADTLAAVFE
jgi:predicted transposase/invertase (TIGR01784 family)